MSQCPNRGATQKHGQMHRYLGCMTTESFQPLVSAVLSGYNFKTRETNCVTSLVVNSQFLKNPGGGMRYPKDQNSLA